MARFLYKAKKGPGEVFEGSIEADSEKAAVNKLMEKGSFPVWIKEEGLAAKEKRGLSLFPKKVKTKDLAHFTRQLSDLLDSGLALFDSLNIIENQVEVPQLKGIIGKLKDGIKDGSTFSDSLKAYPRTFSNLYVNLVKSGEAGSMLNESLNNVADFLEKQEETRSKIMAALAYPMLMAIVGFMSVVILMAFVIPKLANMFVDMGEVLPLPTRILISLSDFTRGYGLVFFLFAGGLIFAVKKSNRIPKKVIDNFKLKIPIFGRLIKDTEFARFSRTLSTLLKNGVPILNSLKITSDIIDNEVIKVAVVSVHDDVRAGSRLAAAIKKNASFPQFIINMTAIGEEGGFLDKTLLKVARSYEVETDRTVKVLSSLLEPIIILVMGLIVGFIVVSMLLPVFQISITAS